jgi:hypothetical protein
MRPSVMNALTDTGSSGIFAYFKDALMMIEGVCKGISEDD